MADTQEMLKSFTAQLVDKTSTHSGGLMQIELAPDFKAEHWDSFLAFYFQKAGEGILDWDLDLRRLNFITSAFLGSIVWLNTHLGAQKGSLRLTVAHHSKIADLIYLSKLNRIITTREI